MSNKLSIPCITLENVTKAYTLHGGRPSLLAALSRRKQSTHSALDQINLTVYPGDRIGIVGSNGSGKTTLLKVIAGIITPTSGKVRVKGRVLSLIALTAGLNSTLSGRDNIALQMSLYGSPADELRNKQKAIIRYADIGSYIDEPTHAYSSGMLLRLTFAIIIHLEADIYLFDEFLSVGDPSFQQKTQVSLQKLMQAKKTILIASQHLTAILPMCSHIVTIDQGQIPDQPPFTPKLLEFYRKNIKHHANSLTVISSSMIPTFKPGDKLNFIQTPFTSIVANDIIVFCFKNYPQLIAHRVYAIAQTAQGRVLITQGDANNQIDQWIITPAEYVGKVIDI